MIIYKDLNRILKENGISKTSLQKGTGLSSRTVAKIAKEEKIAASSQKKIEEYLQNRIGSINFDAPKNTLLSILREEKAHKIPGGIYHELQIRMTYNSNHIEGSRLTEDQTRMIFETSTIDAGDGVPVDDILETVHHFRAMDYCIDHAEEVLSEEMIKHLHYLLKSDTKDASLSWFAVGNYKKRANMVGGRETAKPSEVRKEMRRLLEEYHAIEQATVQDVIAFHARFEKIHPFQDGNGRVGRLIAFKECLKNDIVPFIIEDAKKAFYYRGLSNWEDETGWLTDTCLDGQDTVQELLRTLDIKLSERQKK